MDPIDFDALSSTPYRLPARHPAAGRGTRRALDGDVDDELSVDTPSIPAATPSDAGSAIRRRQESLILSYIINRAGRY